MEEIVIQSLDGKQLEVQEIRIVKEGSWLNLYMHFVCDRILYNASFYNVSRINMINFSIPMQIGGFELISNIGLGWDASSRYMFNDFEDTTLNFYFEDFEINR